MALIKCPECGNQISDRALKCPQCGCPMKEQEKKCPECGETVSENDFKCPNCGYPLQQKRNEIKLNVVEKEEEQTTCGIAVLAMLCGVVSLIILPIVFVPIGFILCFVSALRINSDKRLKGLGVVFAAALLLFGSTIWLIYCFVNEGKFWNYYFVEQLIKYYGTN